MEILDEVKGIKKGVESQTTQELKDKSYKANKTLGIQGRKSRSLKIAATKANTFINGKNLHEVSNEKAIETMRGDIVNGKNMLQRRTHKANKTKSKKNSDGYSINDITSKKVSDKKIAKSIELYGIYKIITKDNKYEGLIFSMLEIRRISGALQKTSKDKSLGSNNSAKSLLIKYNKGFLIDSYIERIKD